MKPTKTYQKSLIHNILDNGQITFYKKEELDEQTIESCRLFTQTPNGALYGCFLDSNNTQIYFIKVGLSHLSSIAEIQNSYNSKKPSRTN